MKNSKPSHRQILVELLKALTPTFTPLRAAEVGVAFGATSETLLREIPQLELLMVDPWRVYYQGQRGFDYFERSFATAVERVSFAGDRAKIFRADSIYAAPWVPDESFALVFIDGDHRYEAVRDDLTAWWRKVAPGGLLTGHDYHSRKNQSGAWGVKKAVDEFVERKGLLLEHQGTVWVVRKEGTP